MKVICLACNIGERFIKTISYDTERIPHQFNEYKCERCGFCFDWVIMHQMILSAHGEKIEKPVEVQNA